MEESTLEFIKLKIEQVEKESHGEVIIKIKNGYVYRVLATCDTMVKDSVKNT